MSNNKLPLSGLVSVNIGHSNFLASARILAVLEPASLPIKRLREHASEKGTLIDATAGRKVRSVIVLDSGHVALSALTTQKLQERLFPGIPLKNSEPEVQMSEFLT